MASTWALVRMESPPFHADSPDPAGLLRFGCGIAAIRAFVPDDPLLEFASAIEAAVPELVRHETLFIDSDLELQGSDLTHLPAAFVVLMSRPGSTQVEDYGMGAYARLLPRPSRHGS